MSASKGKWPTPTRQRHPRYDIDFGLDGRRNDDLTYQETENSLRRRGYMPRRIAREYMNDARKFPNIWNVLPIPGGRIRYRPAH